MTVRRDVDCEDLAHCITCSDEANRMRVLSVDADGAIAVCVDDEGRQSEVMLALTPEAKPGVEVLVHAGVALSLASRVEGNP
ncbi:MAG TPA: HypC/HybG/HupF family hydrogenase formation chaperone [Gemmatimonadaceae bacterium]|jgi:hydrogenase maturation factor|nr:HypC/HybG/HupF family hydrogenase formation chaperone [Gemmatimonadaceae bacterium]